MTKQKELILFLEKHLGHMVCEGGSGLNLAFPDHELMPFDYLEFARQSLAAGQDVKNRIDCVSHLKRALECELDTIFGVMGIELARDERNVPTKLKMIGELGILDARSLSRLNQVRNKVEHLYSEPPLENLEIYFDLVAAVVYALDGYMFMLAQSGKTEWSGDPEGVKDRESSVAVGVTLRFDPSRPEVVISVRDVGNEWECRFAKSESWNSFAFGIRVHHLLVRAGSLFSSEYVVQELKKLELAA